MISQEELITCLFLSRSPEVLWLKTIVFKAHRPSSLLMGVIRQSWTRCSVSHGTFSCLHILTQAVMQPL